MEHLHRAGGGRPGGGAAGRGAALGLPEGQVQALLLPRPRPQHRSRHLRGGLPGAQQQSQALAPKCYSQGLKNYINNLNEYKPLFRETLVDSNVTLKYLHYRKLHPTTSDFLYNLPEY